MLLFFYLIPAFMFGVTVNWFLWAFRISCLCSTRVWSFPCFTETTARARMRFFHGCKCFPKYTIQTRASRSDAHVPTVLTSVLLLPWPTWGCSKWGKKSKHNILYVISLSFSRRPARVVGTYVYTRRPLNIVQQCNTRPLVLQ